jgi:hypothetical protein
MRPELGAMIPQFVVALLLQLAVVWALTAWGRWTARRQGEGVWWRRASHAPAAAFVLGFVGVAISSLMLISAFDSVSTADPSSKATRLAEGISRAMTAAAAPLLLSWLLYAGSVVTFLVGSFKPPARTAPP